MPRNLDNTKFWQRCGDVGTIFIAGRNEDWAAIPQASMHGGKLEGGIWSYSYVYVPKKNSETHKGHVEGCLYKVTLFVLGSIHMPYNPVLLFWGL